MGQKLMKPGGPGWRHGEVVGSRSLKLRDMIMYGGISGNSNGSAGRGDEQVWGGQLRNLLHGGRTTRSVDQGVPTETLETSRGPAERFARR